MPAPTLADQAFNRLKVVRADWVANDVRLFELIRADGGDLPPFTAGAHVAVITPGGPVRKYSLCNDPQERERYQIAVKREASGRGGSLAMVDRVQVGDTIEVSAPKNDFAVVPSSAGYTLIAGGIGITPLLAMARVLKCEGKRFKLYYLTRSPEMTAFRDVLSSSTFKGNVIIHHDGGDPQKAFDLWQVLEKPTGHVYCCGPRALMDAVRDMTGHWSSAAVHFEAFQESSAAQKDDQDFTVVIKKSGERILVPAGTTILEALRSRGYAVPSSCESGTCGSCKTTMVSGKPDHRDLVLTEHEKEKYIMVCVSRAESGDIVLAI